MIPTITHGMKKFMTPSEFDLAIAHTRLRERAIEASKLVLLDGCGYAEAGRRIGLTRQAVEQAVRAVQMGLKRGLGLPDGWVVRTVVVPPEVDLQICALAEAAQAGLRSQS